MKILFRTKDPLENTVVLDQVCLEKHILVNHPIMRRFKDRIRGTIQDPSMIYMSKTDRTSLIYYKTITISPRPRYLMVIAMPGIVKDALYIKTSFLVYNFNKGDELLWEKN